MRQMRVLPVPEKIWEYGLRYCNGAQKMIDVARFRYASYSKGIGSITNNGILFNGLYYGCEEGFRERWFDRARLEGRTKISVAYDTEDRRSIYIKVDSHSSPCECLLLDGNKITTPLTEAEVEQINRIDHEECERYRIPIFFQEQEAPASGACEAFWYSTPYNGSCYTARHSG